MIKEENKKKPPKIMDENEFKDQIKQEAEIETLTLPITNEISLFKNSSESIQISTQIKGIASNSSMGNKSKNNSNSDENKKDKEDLSIKTDSSSDEYSSTEEVRNPSSVEKKLMSSLNTQNSIVSLKYNRNLQRKSVCVVNGLMTNKFNRRDSISLSKKDVSDMGINLEILRLKNSIKENKNRINYADLLKGLMELFIRNACCCDTSSLRSIYK